MRNAIVLAASLMMCACMQKQTDGTYRVPANGNAAKAGAEVKKATDQVAHSDAVKKLESGIGKVATKAGEKLQQAGAKAQADAAKRH